MEFFYSNSDLVTCVLFFLRQNMGFHIKLVTEQKVTSTEIYIYIFHTKGDLKFIHVLSRLDKINCFICCQTKVNILS